MNLVPVEVLVSISANLAWPDRLALKNTCRHFSKNIDNTFIQRLDWLLGREANGLIVPASSCDPTSDWQFCGNADVVQILRDRRNERDKEPGPAHVLSLYRNVPFNPQWWLAEERHLSTALAKGSSIDHLCSSIIQNGKQNDTVPILDIVIAKDPTRGVNIKSYSIETMGQIAHLTGFLHSSDDKNDFRICTAHSVGCFISKTLLDRIPADCRPPIDPKDRREVPAIFGSLQAIGSATVPFYVVVRESVRFHFILKFLVFPKLLHGMLVPATYFNTLLSSCQYGGVPTWSSIYVEPAQFLASSDLLDLGTAFESLGVAEA